MIVLLSVWQWPKVFSQDNAGVTSEQVHHWVVQPKPRLKKTQNRPEDSSSQTLPRTGSVRKNGMNSLNPGVRACQDEKTFHYFHVKSCIAKLMAQCMCLCEWMRLCQNTVLRSLTNEKLYWTMMKCNPAQEINNVYFSVKALVVLLLRARLVLQGPVDLLERVTPMTASLHPYEPSRAV